MRNDLPLLMEGRRDSFLPSCRVLSELRPAVGRWGRKRQERKGMAGRNQMEGW